MNQFFRKKRVLVTGACGTVGGELVRQLAELDDIAELVGIDNNESELFFLDQRYAKKVKARFFLADVRDKDKMCRMMRGIDIVFHTAAFKHVIMCEVSPLEAVQTNILGVQNIIAAASENNVQTILFTSSDKAVNPTNVMGTSKLMGERLMTAANNKLRRNGQIFASTRFGNVLGSRGSVIPVFREQIRRGGPVTVTSQEMSRFIMTLEQAVRLVIDSAGLTRGGEVFVTKMPAIKIQTLAEVMIQELAPEYGYKPEDIEITYIGSKPGEKIYEELMNMEEIRRAVELQNYFAVLPAFKGLYRETDYNYPDVISEEITNPYISANEEHFSHEELRKFLIEDHLLEEPVDSMWKPAERHFPGD